jgi:hypothetical protein
MIINTTKPTWFCLVLLAGLLGCSKTEGAVAAAGGGSAASGGDAPAQPDLQQQAALQQAVEQMQSLFDEHKIQVDTAAGTVTIPAVMNAPRDPIEYLLIHRKGKMHEAMFFTFTKPSVLNTALLLLGMEQGSNATYREKDPAPSLEEVRAGVDPIIVTPPQGKPFWMTVRFDPGDGTRAEHCIEDLIYDLGGDGPVGPTSWVYLGGRMASLYKDEPEVYIADFEGNIISVCYLTPDNHLGTMSHERARDDQNWWLTDKCPADGTEVEFVFHVREPELAKVRRKRLADQGAPRQAPQSEIPEGRNGGR